MNSAPKPNTSGCFVAALGLASTGLGAVSDLAGDGVAAGFATCTGDFGSVALAVVFTGAGFGAGAGEVFVASLAGAAAAFFGAALVVVFFGADDAADLLVAAGLLFVLTVLAFSLLVEDVGAVDFGADVDNGTVEPGSDFAANPSFNEFSAGLTSLTSAFATGASEGTVSTSSSAKAGTLPLAESPSCNVLTVVGADGCECSAFTAKTSSTGPFWAAASISEDVMTLRFAGDASDTEGAVADLDDIAGTGLFTAFPETFFLEPAIASTSRLPGYHPGSILHCNITLDVNTPARQVQLGGIPVGPLQYERHKLTVFREKSQRISLINALATKIAATQ